MGNKQFSTDLLARVRNSAIQYAHKVFENKHVSSQTANRVEAMTGYMCSEEDIKQREPLDTIISFLNSRILSEQKNARNNLARYNYSRHIELYKLQSELIEKRNKILTYCA